MIKVDNLSYSFPQKDLYTNISFTLEDGQHCAFIGASGSGKSTLIDIIMDPERYMFDGKLEIDPNCKIGYVSQFSQREKTGKSTLIDIIMDPERYMFDGKLEIDPNCKIGYVSQFSQREKTKETTVFEYIAEEFIKLQEKIASICTQMETSSDIETLLEEYQEALDAFDAIDGDDFESNINKKLNLANLSKHKDRMIS